MAIDSDTIIDNIKGVLDASDFDTDNVHSKTMVMVTAKVNAVVAEIKEKAEVETLSGGHFWYGGTHDHVHGPGNIQ